MKLKRLLIFIPTIGLIFLLMSNPTLEHYQEKLVTDFGQFHGGMQLTSEQIQSLGSGNRNSFLLFSTYEFKMGNIGVKYWGIAGQTIFIKSFKENEQQEKETKNLESV